MSSREQREKLLSALEGLTKTVVLENDVGSAIVTQYGARILGVFVGDRQNPFWVSKNLSSAISSGEWNIGGNRLWVSPERRFYYRRPEGFEDWLCQSSLDPGNWSIVSSSGKSVNLDGEAELEDFASQTRIHLSFSRQISIRGESVRKGLEHVELKVRDAMVARGEVKNGVNLWSLTQVRPGGIRSGTVIVPTRRGAKPIHYFGKIPRDRLKVSGDHVSFKIDGAAIYKLGIAPEDVPQPGCSRILYYAEHGRNEVFLVSMGTMMAPVSQEECLDVAKADPAGPKGCVQSYNSGPDLCFGEIELHFKPATRVKDSFVSYADYDIDVFAGRRGDVLRLLRKIIPKPFLF
ncbi:MAG: hypothetical protein FGF51_08350 [Candidatus Brockarchaeota archaeon]|nr:hypothetical protein [Candidatus Brockarchaeota archaeon]